MNAKRVREITPYKSASFTTGSIQPRKLTKVEDLLSPDEFAMYTQFCQLADEA